MRAMLRTVFAVCTSLMGIYGMPSAHADPADRSTEQEAEADVQRFRAEGRARGTRFGVSNAFYVGLGGDYANPKPAYAVGLDLGMPTSDTGRYHFEIDYYTVNDRPGVRFSPIGFGFGVPAFAQDQMALEVELLVSVLQLDVFPTGKLTGAASSALKAQVVFAYDIFFVAAELVGVEVRYLEGVVDVGGFGGVGANWPLRLTVGVEP